MTQLPDDRVVVIGGRDKDGGTAVRSLEVIDFAAGTNVLRNNTEVPALSRGSLLFPTGM